MFLIHFLRWFFGYVKFEGSGEFPERFLNLTAQNAVGVWGSKRTKTGISAYMRVSDYKEIRAIARKTKMHLKIKSRHGLPFKIHLYQNRPGLVVGAVFALLLMHVLSLNIWNITITGYEYLEPAEIYEALELAGLRQGMRVNEVDPDVMRQDLLLSLPELSWAAININGTHARVDVREVERLPETLDESPGNVVASHRGIITSVNTMRGVSQVRVGDAVLEGDLLISGIVEHLNGDVTFLRADGRVTAEVIREISISQPLSFSEDVRTGRVSSRRVINFFGINFPLYLGSFNRPHEMTMRTNQLTLDGVELPLGVATGRFYETRTIHHELNQEQAIEKIRERAVEVKAYELLDAKILETNEEVVLQENEVTIHFTLKVQQNIEVFEDILVE